MLDTSASQKPKSEGTQVLVSFIIPALNEEKHIGACLESIRRLEIPSYVRGIEMIVVDNHSTDRTAEISQKLGAKLAIVVQGSPSRARNVGAVAASGDWLAFIDADCTLPSNWLNTCGEHLDGEVKAVAAGSVAADPGPGAPWLERAWHEISHEALQAKPRNVRWLPTFNLLVTKQAFERVGGFDEKLITCEDCDLGYKLALEGRLVLDSRTRATHLGVSGSLREFFRREAWRSRGNLRLALRRPFDWSNWVSLLLPPCLVLGFLTSVAAASAAILWHRSVWPWLGVFTIVVVAMTSLTMRKSLPTSALSFGRRVVVFATFLSGRTAGLLLPFRRVNR